MKKALCIATALFAISWASAQTGSSGQSQPGGSSDQSSMSSSKQGTQEKGMKKGGKKETTLTGCLSGPNAEGNYELQHGAKKVEVASSEDLKAHVGHTVKLHGSYVKAAAMEKKEAGEKGEAAEKGGMKEEKAERHFNATSIDHISDTCKGGAKGGEMGEHKMNHKMKKGDMKEGGGMAEPTPSPTPK
jgi:hypothetical protein